MAEPPFANQAAYAAKLLELVPDVKATVTDSDHVGMALDRYSEAYPCWEHADVGDGTTFEWDLQAAPFAEADAGFEIGFSDVMGLVVEELDGSGNPYRPPVKLLEGRDHYLDRRTVSTAPKLYLVFTSAPPSTKHRVKWRRRWAIGEVAEAHQMAVVYRAAAYKCTNLATVYADTVDPSATASDLFNAAEKVPSYRELAAHWMAEFRRVLGIGTPSSGLATGKARTGQNRVFPGSHLRGGTIGRR